MKTLITLALLAVLGFAAAGCGSGKKGSISVTVVTTTPSLETTTVGGPVTPTARTIKVLEPTATIPSVKTGTRILCKGWKGRGVKVPPPGSAANVGEGEITQGGTVPSSSQQIQLDHLENGSVTVSCTPSN